MRKNIEADQGSPIHSESHTRTLHVIAISISSLPTVSPPRPLFTVILRSLQVSEYKTSLKDATKEAPHSWGPVILDMFDI